jgi:hypothetical protein
MRYTAAILSSRPFLWGYAIYAALVGGLIRAFFALWQ